MRHVIVMTAATSAGSCRFSRSIFCRSFIYHGLAIRSSPQPLALPRRSCFFGLDQHRHFDCDRRPVSRAHGKGDSAGARRLAASSLVHVFLIALWLAVLPGRSDGDSFPHRRPRHGSRCRLDLSRDHASGYRFARSRHGAREHLARRWRRQALYVCDARGSRCHRSSRSCLYFWSRPRVTGAAIVTLISRFVFVAVGLNGAIRMHDLIATPDRKAASLDLVPIMAIAIPAVLTNLAAPVANAYTMRIFSQFGEAVVAAFAILDRLNPMAFGVLFALSSAVGPIMGQNLGAKLISRVRRCSRTA